MIGFRVNAVNRYIHFLMIKIHYQLVVFFPLEFIVNCAGVYVLIYLFFVISHHSNVTCM